MSDPIYGDRPRRAYLFPTIRCNLGCAACYSASRPTAEATDPPELTTGEYRRLLARLRRLGLHEFDISGGEPLLHPGIFEILDAAAGEQTSVLLVTNGTLLAQRLDRRRPEGGFGGVHRLFVSLDAPGAELHDRLRGLPGAFDEAMRGLAALGAAGFDRLGINYLVQPENLGMEAEMLDLALQLGARQFQLLRPIDVGAEARAGRQLRDEQLEALYHRLLEALQQRARRASRRGLELTLVLPGHHFAEHLRYRRRPALPPNVRFVVQHDPLRGCPAFANAVAVTADGQLTGCTAMVRFAELHVGDLRRDDPETILARWPAQRQILRRREARLRLLEPCRSCDAWNACRGGCPAAALRHHGTLERHDPTCGR